MTILLHWSEYINTHCKNRRVVIFLVMLQYLCQIIATRKLWTLIWSNEFQHSKLTGLLIMLLFMKLTYKSTFLFILCPTERTSFSQIKVRCTFNLSCCSIISLYASFILLHSLVDIFYSLLLVGTFTYDSTEVSVIH